jgi:hypothetical protein
MTDSFAINALWDGVTRDFDAEQAHERFVRGKVAVASHWPFLAVAQSPEEFDQRMALALPAIEAKLDPAVAQQVIDSLVEDWQIMREAHLAAMPSIEVQGRHRAVVEVGEQFFHAASQKWLTVVAGPDGEPIAVEPHVAHLAYIDPSDAQRYSTYPNLNPPVNNGGMPVDPDGFVASPDPDQAGKSDAVIQQRQLTPGAWTVTPGSEYPQHVMPQSEQYGYQSTGSYKDIDKNGCPDCGTKWVDGKLQHKKDCPTLKEFDPHHESSRHTSGVVTTGWTQASLDQLLAGMGQFDKLAGDRYHVIEGRGEAEFPSDPDGYQDGLRDAHYHHSRGGYDFRNDPEFADQSDGYQTGYHKGKAEATDGYPHRAVRHIAGEGVVPTPGPNPNYFSQGTNGLMGDMGYPTDPGPEPLTHNQVDDFYGAVPPLVSSGTDGSQNGPYSLQDPQAMAPTASRRPLAERTAATDRRWDDLATYKADPDRQGPSPKHYHDGFLDGVLGRDGTHHKHPKAEESYQLGHGHGRSVPNDLRSWVADGGDIKQSVLVTAAFNDSHVSDYVNWAQGEGHDPDHPKTLKRYEQRPGIGKAHTNFLADQLYIGSGDQDWRKSAMTDGRIVGHCDHCSKPVRLHTENGEHELRHLHSGSNWCAPKATDSLSVAKVSSQFFDPTDPSVRTAAIGDPQDMSGQGVDPMPGGQGLTQDSSGTADANVPVPDPMSSTGSLQAWANQYIKRQGDSWVITQKGTGKVLSHHDSQEEAEASFRAMMESKHGVSLRAQADGVSIERPTAENPTGRGSDEFQATHWDNIVQQRPMQAPDGSGGRNINSPVLPAAPIRTIDTNRPGGRNPQQDEVGENQNEDSREASLRTLAQIMEAD